MDDTLATHGPAHASVQGLVAQLGRIMLFGLASVPFGMAKAVREEPLRWRPTEPDETFWIVPEISFEIAALAPPP